MPSDNDLHKAAHKGMLLVIWYSELIQSYCRLLGDLDDCKRLVEEPEPGDDPIDVNSAGASDRRPVHRAAGAGHLDIW